MAPCLRIGWYEHCCPLGPVRASGLGPSHIVLSLPSAAFPPFIMKPSVRPRRYSDVNGYGRAVLSFVFGVPPPHWYLHNQARSALRFYAEGMWQSLAGRKDAHAVLEVRPDARASLGARTVPEEYRFHGSAAVIGVVRFRVAVILDQQARAQRKSSHRRTSQRTKASGAVGGGGARTKQQCWL